MVIIVVTILIIAQILITGKSGQPVIPTARLAEFYDCQPRNIQQNFNNNSDRFIEGKHYFKLEGDALKDFRNYVENFDVDVLAHTKHIYLWTKRGCARHAKMLNTDKAWEVFEALEDRYFSGAVKRDDSLPPVTDFQRGTELAKLAPHAKDPFAKQCIVAKAANLILGEEFLPVPDTNLQMQLTLFS